MRASGSDHTERITPATIFSLEQALEFIADDEASRSRPSRATAQDAPRPGHARA